MWTDQALQRVSRDAQGAERDGVRGKGVPSLPREGSGEGARPLPQFFLLLSILVLYLSWI